MKKRIIAVLISACMVLSLFPCVSFAETAYFEAKLNTISELLDECDALGISTPYEDVCFETMQRFAEYISNDEASGVSQTIINANKSAMDGMYNEVRNNLDAYIEGTKVPFLVNDVDMTSVLTDGATLKSNGKPVYSVGYGYFNTAREDVGNFKKFGADNIQLELGPNRVLHDDDKVAQSWVVLEGSNVSLSTSEHSVGSKSFKFENSGKLYQNIFVKQGSNCNLSFDVKGDPGVTVTVAINGTNYNISGITGAWTQKSIDFQSERNSAQNSFFIEVSGSGNVFIDNVQCTRAGKDGNYIINGSFEDDLNIRDLGGILKALAIAENQGVSVSLLLSPHYFPEGLSGTNLYTNSNEFIKFNIDHPTARTVIENYLRFIVPIISKYDSVTNICLSNEPLYDTRNASSFYNPLFRSYLQTKYGTIASLNSNYGTSYSSFNSISMPNSLTTVTPLVYDWVMFNKKVLTDWHSWMTGIVKEYTNKPIDIKMQERIRTSVTPEWLMKSGSSAEAFASFTDWSGHDASSYSDTPDMYYGKMLWYDYLFSVTGKPVYNSEDHVIRDKNLTYEPTQAKHIRSDLWQGAIHGRSMSTLWLWERSFDPDSSISGGILTRPDCVWAVGKTALDLKRLSNYVNLINTQKPEIAIFYSESSSYHGYDHINALTNVYKALVKNGVKVGFVSEGSLDQLSRYDTLIVPNAGYVTDAARTAIESYINSGKTVITDSYSFKKNEYSKSASSSIINNYATISNNLADAAVSAVNIKVELIDDNTGSKAENVEYQYAFDGDDVIINIFNTVSGNTKDLSVYVNGVEAPRLKNLITGTLTTGNTITVAGYEPTLVRISARDGITGSEVKELTNVSVDASGLLTWDCDDEYYSTASIYNVVTNELIATPNVKSFQIPTDVTYRIKAKNIFGQYSKPAYVTFVKDSQYKGKVFSIDITALSENNGTVTADVSVENIYPVKVAGKTVVRVKDENGNVLARAYFDGLYEIGAVKSARVSLSAGTGAYTVEAFVTSSLNDDHADSAIYTVNIPELTNLTLNNPIVE